MPTYAALIYSRDVDWTLPEYAHRHEGVQRVRPGRRGRHPRRRGALPDQHRHHRPRAGRQGRRRRHLRRPLRRDQGSAHRLLPAGVRRPRRGDQGRRADPRRPGTARSRCGRSSISAGDHGRSRRPRRPRPPRARRGQARAGHARPAHRRPAAGRGRRAGRDRARAGDLAPRRRARGAAGLAHPTARRRAIDLLRREAARAGKEAEARDRAGPTPPPPETVRDDLLRLVFTCCHPALSHRGAGGAGLRTLCGLSVAEVGRGAAGARGDDGQAPHPGPPEDRQGGDPVPGARRPRAARPAARRAGHRLPGVQRRGTRRRGATAARAGRRGGAADPAAARADAGRAVGARAARPGAAAGLPARRPPRRRRARPCCSPTRTAAGGPRPHRGGGGARRRGAAPHTRPARPVRRAGRDRRLPRPGADLGRHRLGRRRVVVRRAAHGARHAGGAAQPGGRGRRARGARGRARGGRRGRGPRRATRSGTPAAPSCSARLDRRAEADAAYAAALAIPQDDAQLSHLQRRRDLLADRSRTG